MDEVIFWLLTGMRDSLMLIVMGAPLIVLAMALSQNNSDQHEQGTNESE